jgi:ubiquinone/menaquinone biosynthesis C-methylase UbiE
MIESILFTWLQGANFYHDLHRCAVQSLPPGDGKTWLDVGCGPGLVSRLAAEQSYRAHGVDTNPRMIKAAQVLARKYHSSAIFSVRDISAAPLSAEVVSAASLLAVLDDKRAGLHALWNCVLPGGHLLIIEPTSRMTPLNAKALINSGSLSRKRIIGLRLWAAVRNNRTVDPVLFDTFASKPRYIELLHGLVGAWIFEKT